MTLGPLMIDVAGPALNAEDRELLRHPSVGSVILFTRNYVELEQLQALTAEIHALRSPALLIAVDHEGGRVQRFRQGFTSLPSLRQIGHAYDANRQHGLALARQHAWLMASELLAVGVDFSFAPCVDLDYGMSGAIGERALHPRGGVVAELAVAYAHGLREAGMAATAKHFPGHGAVAADSHHTLPIDRRELADLEADLRPYRLLIEGGLAGVMVAHIQFPAIDSAPASFSRLFIQDLLRDELRFKGTIFADDLSMLGAAGMGDIVERCTQSLAAGCEVLPVCNARPQVIKLLDGLRVEPDPLRHMKLARMRGRHGQAPAALRASAEWQRCEQSLSECGAPPELKLKGASG
jgi:beta-N-acetylhexosaminidase